MTDFIGQPFTKIRMAGALRDASGKKVGMMMIRASLDENLRGLATFLFE